MSTHNHTPHAIPPLAELIDRFLEQLRVANYAKTTIQKYTTHLHHFLAWCDERDFDRAAQVTPEVIDRYQRTLLEQKSETTGRNYSKGDQLARLVLLRAFFRSLLKERRILSDPTAELGLPKKDHRLPEVFTAAEVAKVLDTFDVTTWRGLRSRAIFELLYSTGLRRSEVRNLQIYDVDKERAVVTVRQGKGRRDRLVPIGERALSWLSRYLIEVRPGLVGNNDEGHLFLSEFTGGRLHASTYSIIGQRAVKAAGISKLGACHFLRHAMATAMLDRGADIRHIQQILGHEQITTTAIYAEVSMNQLKEVHRRTHPEEKSTPAQVKAALKKASSKRLLGAPHDKKKTASRRRSK